MQEFLLLIPKRGYEFLNGNYQEKFSLLTLFCPKHELIWTTTFDSFDRSTKGCLKCGRESVSEKLTGRVFSDETIVKMRIANNRRPNRGGKPRKWRENAAYRVFRKEVFSIFKNECALSGLKKGLGSYSPLVVHHLFGASSYEDLAYEPLN